MKSQLISMVAGVAALVFIFTPVGANALPLMGSEMLPPMLSGIELTQQQETQLTQLRTQTRAQIESILTPEQLSSVASGVSRR